MSRRCTYTTAEGRCTLHEGHNIGPEAGHVFDLVGHDNAMGSTDQAAYKGGKGLRVTDLLALSHVPRWSIVRNISPQSVADHTFRTMVIYTELCRRLNIPLSVSAMVGIMHHDADECRTADVPASVKDLVAIGSPAKYCPWLKEWDPGELSPEEMKALHLADQIEALTFIQCNGLGMHALRVTNSMVDKVKNLTPAVWRDTVGRLINEIVGEEGR